MKKIGLVIADDNEELRNAIRDFFDTDEEFKVLGTAEDGLAAVAAIDKLHPDVVILDIIMPELDGYEVMSAAANTEGEKPKFIVVSQLTQDVYVTRAIRKGAQYFMVKPINFNSLRTRIIELFEPARESGVPRLSEQPVREYPRINRNLDEKIANIFISVGIPAHIKGYQFLREAIKMAIDNPDIINCITKKLYPEVAERFDTSASKVERAIRHAIEVAWNRGKIENINTLFGIKVYTSNEKPTNGEFIALVADKMLIETA